MALDPPLGDIDLTDLLLEAILGSDEFGGGDDARAFERLGSILTGVNTVWE
ncbi:MAG: hypothetical protein AB7W37_07860 [Syntrophobacteraceae bacterium]